MKIASWKTSAAGAGGIVALLVGTLTKLTDGDPTTIVDWNTVVAAVFACVVGFFARDDKVSSEEAGAKPSTTVTGAKEVASG